MQPSTVTDKVKRAVELAVADGGRDETLASILAEMKALWDAADSATRRRWAYEIRRLQVERLPDGFGVWLVGTLRLSIYFPHLRAIGNNCLNSTAIPHLDLPSGITSIGNAFATDREEAREAMRAQAKGAAAVGASPAPHHGGALRHMTRLADCTTLETIGDDFMRGSGLRAIAFPASLENIGHRFLFHAGISAATSSTAAGAGHAATGDHRFAVDLSTCTKLQRIGPEFCRECTASTVALPGCLTSLPDDCCVDMPALSLFTIGTVAHQRMPSGDAAATAEQGDSSSSTSLPAMSASREFTSASPPPGGPFAASPVSSVSAGERLLRSHRRARTPPPAPLSPQPIISVPGQVTTVGRNCLRKATSLQSIRVDLWGPVAKIEEGFGVGSDLRKVAFPTALTSVGSRFLAETRFLDIVDLSACTALMSIGDNFCAGSNVSAIVLPESVQHIGANFARSTRRLKALDFAHLRRVTAIGAGFAAASAVERFNPPHTLLSLPANFLQGATGLADLDLSACKELTDIGDYCAAESAVRSVRLPPHVSSIGTGFMLKAGRVKEVNLSHLAAPRGKRRMFLIIGDDFLAGCASLQTVVVSPQLSVGCSITIGSRCCARCPMLETFDVSDARECRVRDDFLIGAAVRKLLLPPTLSAIGDSFCAETTRLDEVDLSHARALHDMGDFFARDSSVVTLLLPGVLRWRAAAGCRPVSVTDPLAEPATAADSLIPTIEVMHSPSGGRGRAGEGEAGGPSPPKLRRIPDGFLAGAKSIADLALSPTLTTIGDEFCAGVTSEAFTKLDLSLLETLSRLGKGCCRGAQACGVITLPPKLREVGGDFAFGAPKLKAIELEQCCALVHIGERFASRCPALNGVKIPGAVHQLDPELCAGSLAGCVAYVGGATLRRHVDALNVDRNRDAEILSVIKLLTVLQRDEDHRVVAQRLLERGDVGLFLSVFDPTKKPIVKRLMTVGGTRSRLPPLPPGAVLALDTVSPDYGLTLAHWAVVLFPDLVKRMPLNTEIVAAQTSRGFSALHYAVMHGCDSNTIRALLKPLSPAVARRVGLGYRSRVAVTPLHLAFAYRNFDAAVVLLEASGGYRGDPTNKVTDLSIIPFPMDAYDLALFEWGQARRGQHKKQEVTAQAAAKKKKPKAVLTESSKQEADDEPTAEAEGGKEGEIPVFPDLPAAAAALASSCLALSAIAASLRPHFGQELLYAGAGGDGMSSGASSVKSGQGRAVRHPQRGNSLQGSEAGSARLDNLHNSEDEERSAGHGGRPGSLSQGASDVDQDDEEDEDEGGEEEDDGTDMATARRTDTSGGFAGAGNSADTANITPGASLIRASFDEQLLGGTFDAGTWGEALLRHQLVTPNATFSGGGGGGGAAAAGGLAALLAQSAAAAGAAGMPLTEHTISMSGTTTLSRGRRPQLLGAGAESIGGSTAASPEGKSAAVSLTPSPGTTMRGDPLAATLMSAGRENGDAPRADARSGGGGRGGGGGGGGPAATAGAAAPQAHPLAPRAVDDSSPWFRTKRSVHLAAVAWHLAFHPDSRLPEKLPKPEPAAHSPCDKDAGGKSDSAPMGLGGESSPVLPLRNRTEFEHATGMLRAGGGNTFDYGGAAGLEDLDDVRADPGGLPASSRSMLRHGRSSAQPVLREGTYMHRIILSADVISSATKAIAAELGKWQPGPGEASFGHFQQLCQEVNRLSDATNEIALRAATRIANRTAQNDTQAIPQAEAHSYRQDALAALNEITLARDPDALVAAIMRACTAGVALCLGHPGAAQLVEYRLRRFDRRRVDNAGLARDDGEAGGELLLPVTPTRALCFGQAASALKEIAEQAAAACNTADRAVTAVAASRKDVLRSVKSSWTQWKTGRTGIACCRSSTASCQCRACGQASPSSSYSSSTC
jgi:hypothetical protein